MAVSFCLLVLATRKRVNILFQCYLIVCYILDVYKRQIYALAVYPVLFTADIEHCGKVYLMDNAGTVSYTHLVRAAAPHSAPFPGKGVWG